MIKQLKIPECENEDKIEVYTLYSGSSGNSIYVKYGNTEFLVDAGVSTTMIERALNALGTSLTNISAIFITHEHIDHTYALEVISKKYKIPVHFTAPSYNEFVKSGTFLSKCALSHEVIYCEKVGEVSIKSFEIPHDAKQNVGYIIKTKSETFGIATDIGHITDEIVSSLSECDKIIIEANHDINMLKCGTYPEYLKRRILSQRGHLSNDDCATLICTLAEKGVKSFTLAHLSKENNTEEIAFNTVNASLVRNGYYGKVNIKLSSPAMSVCATE